MNPERRLRVVPDHPPQKFPASVWIKSWAACLGIIFAPFVIFLVVAYAIWRMIRG